MFKAAEANSPNKSVDIVVANAGIGVKDDMMFKMDDPESEPNKPDLPVLDVNLYGVLYTTKLAFHYFQKNPDDDKHDRCLVLQASLAGYLSLPGGLQYQATKYALRGMMMNMRVNFALPHYRGNAISPW
jgi:NAD(P)-dependent dehydrogenase (short-subunit alcohol dehydrogenase family)